jgi:hypothetical protein
MSHEFEVWVKFTQDAQTIKTGTFYSYESFEDCWDKIFKKEKQLRETHPEIKAEYMHSAVSERPDDPDYD